MLKYGADDQHTVAQCRYILGTNNATTPTSWWRTTCTTWSWDVQNSLHKLLSSYNKLHSEYPIILCKGNLQFIYIYNLHCGQTRGGGGR